MLQQRFMYPSEFAQNGVKGRYLWQHTTHRENVGKEQSF